MSLSGDQPITGFFSRVTPKSRRSRNTPAVRYSSKRKRAQTDAHSSSSEGNDVTPKPPTRKAKVKESGDTPREPDANNEGASLQRRISRKDLQVEKGEGASGLVNPNGLQTPLTSAVRTTNKRTSALHEHESPVASSSSAMEVARRRVPHAGQKALQTPPPTNLPEKHTSIASTSTPFTPLTLVTTRGLESSSISPVRQARARLDKTVMLPPTPVTDRVQRGSIFADSDIVTSPLHIRNLQDGLVSLSDPFVSDAAELVVPSSQSLDLNREFDVPSSPHAPTSPATSSPTFKVPALPGHNPSEQFIVQSSQSQYIVPYDSSPVRRRPSSILGSGDSTSSPVEEVVQSSQSQVETELTLSKAYSQLSGNVSDDHPHWGSRPATPSRSSKNPGLSSIFSPPKKSPHIVDTKAQSGEMPDPGEVSGGQVQDSCEATTSRPRPADDPDDSATESESEYESIHPAAFYRTKDTPHLNGVIDGVSHTSEDEVDPDLENFRNMFTGDGSYPESFPMSLR